MLTINISKVLYIILDRGANQIDYKIYFLNLSKEKIEPTLEQSPTDSNRHGISLVLLLVLDSVVGNGGIDVL